MRKLFYLLSILICFQSCNAQQKKTNMHKYTNALIHESSPYLLQHAHNPVNWQPWNPEIVKKATQENKLIIISVGYAACHWCHVMEHESFEDEEVASIMNEHFISVKIDREERPDIDQVYMTAVQMMTGQGGWPLNCITLPNGKPLWGGTYFRKHDWMNALQQLASLYQNNPKKAIDYANNLSKGLQEVDLVQPNTNAQQFSKAFIEKAISKWSLYFDEDLGGTNQAPKFPMPTNYHFLLRYAHQTKDKQLLSYVNTTLHKMAMGGIFDQIGGGFARYSVDAKWHIPHFEKMLYDNGQLVSLYADAYLLTKNELYKETVIQTLEFLERELKDTSNGFYAALDADSLDEDEHLEEGAFYVWKKEILQQLIPDFDLFADYYNINSYGHWEKGNYHLIRTTTDSEFTKQHQLTSEALKNKVHTWQQTLLKARSKRERPRLDDKILTSWNALVLKGYCDAYRVFNNPHYLEMALKNATFIERNLHKEDGSLYRNYKNDKATINAFLEDYATLIDAYISLYQITFDEKWLSHAKQLTDYCFDHFYDDTSKMFFFTSDEDEKLITRKIENSDNVIPASNSIMANNLFKLSQYFDNAHYLKISKQMLHNVATERMQNYASSYSNWLHLYLNITDNFYEVALIGENIEKKRKEIDAVYIPNKLLVGTVTENELPLLQNRFVNGKTMIYVCQNNACKLPTDDAKTAIKQLKNN